MAIDLFDEFATDTTAEEEGAWETFADEVRFKIARSTSKTYTRILTKSYEKNRRLLSTQSDASEAKSEELMIDAMARGLLLDWENVVWQKKPLPYTLENAKMILANRDFRRWVMQKAEDFDRFKLAQEAEDEGK